MASVRMAQEERLKNQSGFALILKPVWLGEENIAGKTLFIHWEQGFGDTIQFCRYAKLVEARGAKVIMSVQQPLYGLLKQISPDDPDPESQRRADGL